MIAAAVCQRWWRLEVQKPALVKTSLRAVIALWAVGCGTSPIEAVVAADEMPSGSAGSSATPPLTCDNPGRLFSTETGCLRRGEATTVFGDPAYTVELSADCGSALAQWDLTPAAGGTFTVRNLDSQLSLDVRAASDLPGTPVILYEPTTLDNQRFFLQEHSVRSYTVAPRHAPSLCVEARGSGVEIWPCDPENPAQLFAFTVLGCQ